MARRIRMAIRDIGRLLLMCLIGLATYLAAPHLLGSSGRRPG